MSRITSTLNALHEGGRKALVPYIVAGDPAPDLTVSLMHALVEQGADLIELGVPFSDPMAEGPVIQLAHERALTHGVSLSDVLEIVASFRRDDNDTPVVLMGYANPVEHMGYEKFAQRARAAGVDGLLTVDMPPEEAEPLTAALQAVEIDSIFLLAPTTTPERIRAVAGLASGYLYYVSLKGVTGAGNLDVDDVARRVGAIKSVCELPVMVGFGIKDPDSARAVGNVADGVVVGSALVDRIAKLAEAGKTGQGLIAEAVTLLGDMRKAL